MTQSLDDRQNLPSASRWRGYELCAGKFQLEQEAERLGQSAHRDSPWAKGGKRMHAYLAGQPDEDGQEIVPTDTERTTVDFLQERAQGEVQRIFGDEAIELSNETRFWLVLSGQRVLSGQADRVIHNPKTGVVLIQDYKTGWLEPDPAEQNAQMKVLAVLVALQMPKTVREVIVQIISGPYGVSEARYDLAALAGAYESILSTLRAIHDPNAPLTPGVEQCRFCPAKLICPALQDKRVGIARLELIALPDGPQASMILDDVAMIRSRCDEIVEYYEAKMLADPAYDLPGYAMVPGAVRREVKDWDAARQRLGEWLELEEINGAANYRLGDLEKALGKKLKIRGKELKDRMNTILGGLVEERQNSASLKRVKGKALVTVE